jgi:hypothetical protein
MKTLMVLFQANIKLSSSQVEPGNNVDITVDTKCNSYVGILGVDQSVDRLFYNRLTSITPGYSNFPDLAEWDPVYLEVGMCKIYFFLFSS